MQAAFIAINKKEKTASGVTEILDLSKRTELIKPTLKILDNKRIILL